MSAIPLPQWVLVAKMLEGFRSAEPRIETGDWIVQQPLAVEEAKNPTVIWEVRKGSTHLCANKPVSVRVRSEGGFVFAENEELRIFGHGRDIESAIQDFNTHVVYFYRYYSNLREDQVAGEGLRLKRLFANIFEPV